MKAAFALTGLVISMATGCSGDPAYGPPLAPVFGTVTLDGRPLEGATIVFMPKGDGTMSMAVSDPAGKYVMRTGSGREGAVVGEHNVTVQLAIGPPPAPVTPVDDGLAPALPNEIPGGAAAAVKKPAAKTTFVVPEKYGKAETSGLGTTVPDGGLKDYEIKLTK